MQRLLFPDPRPLVDTLGAVFFRDIPERPGVYLMRDDGGTVLYVGKAKNLRKRLASYRVANPDRLPRRHLRLLRAVRKIDLQECSDETDALAREAELLLSLRPRFNRAGTWKGDPRFLSWKVASGALQLAVFSAAEEGWYSSGPHGAGAPFLRAALARLLWCAFHIESGLRSLPEGWFSGRMGDVATVPLDGDRMEPHEILDLLVDVCAGRADPFASWIRARTERQSHPFDAAVREEDLETVTRFADRQARVGSSKRG